ncbi:S-adenosylmethionine-dependent methyltransferase [Propionigenium maris DSM 9537]|uniref:S-adenosylmethionine-dependent methyltransferase n=1 Tax=Propionigenium maris DSM 9537 TaxID=1123000 RepID=A0A9W6LLH1_9FUSO|nr:class I SAM-dependent methyltransferase [Propionigenium maris]GLI54709.1 S-adenosylmethionine-dependent methyltransferase [Propionigenium maris DSM 9537]
MKSNRRYKEESRLFFNKVCNKKHGNSEKLDASILGSYPPEAGERVIDLGCGDGRFLEKLRRIDSSIDLYGVDISEKMIAAGKERRIPGCTLEVGDAENLPYGDQIMDRIYCLNSFHHYPNPQRVAEELRRVLKPGGVLIVGEVYVLPGLREIINLLLPYGWTGDYRMYSKKSLNKIFKNNNFINLNFKVIDPFLFTSVYMVK